MGLLNAAIGGAILLALACGSADAEWPVPAMNEQIDQTNFLVNAGCSGTLIDVENRYVLTAAHCVTGQYETITREKIDDKGVVTEEKVRRLKPGEVRQIAFDGATEIREVTFRTKLIATDRVKDLALLQILSEEIPNKIAARLACSAPVRGEAVYIVGNPMGNLYSSVVAGIVSSVQRTYDLLNFTDGENGPQPLIQVSGGIIGGNSGGAVYNDRGELVAVSVVAHRNNEILGFAVPLSVVKEFLTAQKARGSFAHCDPTAGR